MDSRRTRWIIIALLFAATTTNYIDRQTLSVLNDTLRHELHFSDIGYANVVTAFLVAYTIMYSLGGRLIDYLGARMGLALSLAWWSVASMMTGLSRGVLSLGVFRFLLGMGEPCVFPAGSSLVLSGFRRKSGRYLGYLFVGQRAGGGDCASARCLVDAAV